MTPQDVSCSTPSLGNHTCTYSNIPKNQTVTLVANDNGAEIGFFSKTVLSQRDSDPRGTRSQFVDFGGPCATPERGVCVFTASADQTITVRNAPLKLTRIKFIGVNSWDVLISARPTLGIGNNLKTELQGVHLFDFSPSVSRCRVEPSIAVTCYDIISTSDAQPLFSANHPPGPTPLGASGPLAFVGFVNSACGGPNTNPELCLLTSQVDETITMKWQYYLCNQAPPVIGPPFVSDNGGWNYGPKDNCSVVTPL
jgi:hypothetical protein